MRVIYHDRADKLRHGNVEPAASLDDLLAQSDVVTMHVPETAETQDMIGGSARSADEARRAASSTTRAAPWSISTRWPPRSGTSIWPALRSTCFPSSPPRTRTKFVSPLQGLDNVILTPHIGGSTEEAQERIGAEVARKFVDYSDNGSTTGRGELPAGAAAAAVLRHALHPRASQRARRARPAQRGLRPAPHQHRRAVLPNRQRDRLRRAGRGGRRARRPGSAGGHPRHPRHDLRAAVPEPKQLAHVPDQHAGFRRVASGSPLDAGTAQLLQVSATSDPRAFFEHLLRRGLEPKEVTSLCSTTRPRSSP